MYIGIHGNMPKVCNTKEIIEKSKIVICYLNN